MSAPQIIRTPSGEELLVLPRAEYEALLDRADHEAEDADDVAISDAWKVELAAGGVVLPPEVSAAILRGDSRLKSIRIWRDVQLKCERGTSYRRPSWPLQREFDPALALPGRCRNIRDIQAM